MLVTARPRAAMTPLQFRVTDKTLYFFDEQYVLSLVPSITNRPLIKVARKGSGWINMKEHKSGNGCSMTPEQSMLQQLTAPQTPYRWSSHDGIAFPSNVVQNYFFL